MEKRGILFLGAAGVIFGCGFLWHWLHLPASAPETHQICLQDGAQRLAFLESQGQPERCCVATETVQLPAAADGSYSEYAALQQAPGAAAGITPGRDSRPLYLYTEQPRRGTPAHRAAAE